MSACKLQYQSLGLVALQLECGAATTEMSHLIACLACSADDLTWEMVAKEASTGKAYLHKHKDVSGQPVIVIRSSLHNTGQHSMMQATKPAKQTSCILEKALKVLPVGQDTVLGIFDLKGFKQKNGDLGFAGFLVSYLVLLLCKLHMAALFATLHLTCIGARY